MMPKKLPRVPSSVLLLAAAAIAATACSSSIGWRNHIAFRSSGTDLQPSTFSARDLVDTAISTNLHYVTVSLDSVFFRNLPGIASKADVVFGFEINGVLGDGKAIKTVLDAKQANGPNAFLNFDNLTVIEPFLYRGETVTIKFNFTVLPQREAEVIRAQLQGPAAEMLKRINPLKAVGVDAGFGMFSQVFGLRAQTWQYSFSMFPADRIYRDKPDLLFTGTRHILISVPTADAPEELQKFRPSAIFRSLKMSGNRLVWAKSGDEFTELPYIILNITRFKRYPKEGTDLKKALKTIDAHIDSGSLEIAKSSLQAVGALINADPVITATEKNLERTLVQWREKRIAALRAKKEKNPEEEIKHLGKEVDVLIFALREFHKILEPFEVKDFTYRINDRLNRTDELARELKNDPAWLRGARTRYAAVVKEIEAPPPPPDKAGPPIAFPAGDLLGMEPRRSRSVLKKWWFWTALGVAAAGGTTAALLLTRASGSSGLGYPSQTVGLPPQPLIGIR